METAEDLIHTSMEHLSASHADMRSSEKAANRLRKQKQKYYGYRGVHPSWVGQQYYTLTLVSEDTTALSESKKGKKFHAMAVVEQEHEALFDSLTHNQDFVTQLTIPSSIHQAIAETRAARYTAAHSDHRRNTLKSFNSPKDTMEAPASLTQLTECWRHSSDPLSTFLARNRNSRLKLKLKRWTKRDNFEQKEFFSGGPDRRHSRSRRIREWNSQHYEIRRLGRAARQQGAMRAGIEEEVELLATGHGDGKTLDGWGWNGDVFEYNPAVFRQPEPGPWQTGKPVTEAADDTAADVGAGANADDQAEVEETREAANRRSETLSILESLLASSEIVIVSRPRSDVDVDDDSSIDFDNMSDLADAIADIEWDMLSDCGHESVPVTGADADVI